MHFVTKPTISTSAIQINLKVAPFVQLVNIQLYFTWVAFSSLVDAYIHSADKTISNNQVIWPVCLYVYVHTYVCM